MTSQNVTQHHLAENYNKIHKTHFEDCVHTQNRSIIEKKKQIRLLSMIFNTMHCFILQFPMLSDITSSGLVSHDLFTVTLCYS